MRPQMPNVSRGCPLRAGGEPPFRGAGLPRSCMYITCSPLLAFVSGLFENGDQWGSEIHVTPIPLPSSGPWQSPEHTTHMCFQSFARHLLSI